jgi:integrase
MRAGINAPARLQPPGAVHERMSSVSTKDPNDSFKRHKTRRPGVTYRERADGSRRYFVYAQGKQHLVEGGEREAVGMQAELRGRVARGEKLAPANVRFGALAEEWFASKRKLRPWTRSGYRAALDNELLPRFGRLKLAQVTPDQIAALVRELEGRGLSGSYIQNILKPLNGAMNLAVRRGMLSVNPVAVLTPDERPTVVRREFRELGPDEIDALLAAAARAEYFPLIKTAIYTGLRLGETLGLQWQDLDFEAGLVHIRKQWSREGGLTEPKTPAAVRRVVLAPDLIQFLREHKQRALGRGRARPDDFVFASRRRTPLGHRNVCRAFTRIVKEAKLDGEPKLTFHGLRHVYASMMIERGISSTVLADQMGHASSTITEQRYIHLFNRIRTDEAVRTAVQEAMGLGKSLASTDGQQRETEVAAEGGKIAFLHGSAPTGPR